MSRYKRDNELLNSICYDPVCLLGWVGRGRESRAVINQMGWTDTGSTNVDMLQFFFSYKQKQNKVVLFDITVRKKNGTWVIPFLLLME